MPPDFWGDMFDRAPSVYGPLEKRLERAGGLTRFAYIDAALRFLDLKDYGSASFYAMRVIWDCETNDDLNGVSVSLLQFIEAHHLNGHAAYNLGALYSSAIAVRRDLVRAYGFYERAAKLGYKLGQVRLAMAHAKGDGVWRDVAKATEILKLCRQQNIGGAGEATMECMVAGEAPPPDGMTFMAAYAALAKARVSYQTPYVVRCCLGLGGGTLHSATEAVALRHDGKMWLQRIGTPAFQQFCRTDSIAKALLEAYENNQRPVWRRPLFKNTERSVHLAHLAAALCALAYKERRASVPWWIAIKSRYACIVYGINYERAFQSSVDVGPRHCSISARGIPIGRWASATGKGGMPSEDGFSLRRMGRYITAIAPILDGHRAAYHPALLTDHDVIVAVGLAFGETSGPARPAFSLPRLSNDPGEYETFGLRKKVFTPTWFGATDAGKSFYWADAILPPFGLGRLFSLTNYFENANVERETHLSAFYDDIERAWGALGPDAAVTQLIELTGVELSNEIWNETWLETVEAFRVKHASMRFIGRSINNPGLANEIVAVDSEGLVNGRQAAIATERYDELAQAFPVFARVRLFLALTDALAHLRTARGYKLAPHLRWCVAGMIRWYRWRAVRDEPVLRRDEGLCAETFIKH